CSNAHRPAAPSRRRRACSRRTRVARAAGHEQGPGPAWGLPPAPAAQRRRPLAPRPAERQLVQVLERLRAGARGQQTGGEQGEATEAHGARSYHAAPRLTARSSLRHRAGVRPDELRVELARPEDADTAALAACEALLSDGERGRAWGLRSGSAP